MKQFFSSKVALQSLEMPLMKQPVGSKWFLWILAAGFLAFASLGCAEEVGDIDRTQTNKLEKSLLAGHWYYMQTVIDVPQQSAQGFIGLMNFGNSAKVTFEVTEKYLYILPVVEIAQFSEMPYVNRQIRNFWEAGKSHEFVDMYVGQPIAAFPIESHFDVIREYNTSTGKQSNVLVENTTDRLWHERQYMRVNWGGNALLDWAFATGTTQFSPADHYVQEGVDPYLQPEGAGVDPDLPEFLYDNPATEKRDGYVGFVTKAYMPPSGTDWQGWACNPYGISNKDCAGSVVSVRHSFKQAQPTPDYETVVYTNREHMEKFGLFLSTRYSYDDHWNLTESARDYKAQLWNLWQRTWEYSELLDENGNAISCMNNEDCPGDELVTDYTANRCVKDEWYRPGVCQTGNLMKFSDRGLRPIIYHISDNYDPDTLGVFYETADEWSKVFKETVAWVITLEELNRYWTRNCTVDSDCTAGRTDVMVDQVVPTPKQVPASDAQGCTAGSVASGGQCLQGVGCDTDNPCALDQICEGNVCYAKNEDGSKGTQVLNPVLIPGPMSMTMVIYPDGDGGHGVVPVRDDWLYSTTDPSSFIQMGGNESAVRFVHASPKAGAAQLQQGSSSVGPEVSFTGDWVRDPYVINAGDVTLSVTSEGGTAATTTLSLQPGYVYIAAFVNGDTLVVAGTQVSGEGKGVRFMHAIPGGGLVDGGVTSIRGAEGLAFGELSGYIPSRFEEQRITVLESGAPGDIGCYYAMHEGKCAGWSGEWSGDMDAKFQQNLASLPDMFVVCENRFDLANEGSDYTAAADAGDRSNVFHDGRYSTRDSNPYNPSGQIEAGDTAPGSDATLYNPCKDPEMIAEPYEMKKVGDIRYNLMNWVGEVQASSPLGYGPSAGDPETGQLIWGGANIYGAPLTTYGQWAKDLVDLVNGNLSTEDIITGDYVRQFVESKGDPLHSDNSDTLYYGGLGEQNLPRAEEIFATHGQFDELGHAHPVSDPMKNDELWEFIQNEDLRKELFQGLPTVGSSYGADRLDRIRGTNIESMMINEEVKLGLLGGAIDLSQPLTPEMREQLSPASWMTASNYRANERQRSMVMTNAPCTYDRSFVDDHIYGLAKEFFCTPEEQEQYRAGTLQGKMCLEGDDLRIELTKRIFAGVMEHEVGHTVSLRHNFSGSADLFNFFDEYYQIREKENVICQEDAHCDEDMSESCDADVSCTSSSDCPGRLMCATSGDNSGSCVDGTGEKWGACSLNNTWVAKFVPRAVATQSEREQKMSEYQYSTVMDYGGRFNSDIHGLGKYDYAAIKFAYGKMVEVYADTSLMRNRIDQMVAQYGGSPTRYTYLLSTDNWRYAGTIFSPFYYLESYIGVEQNLNRRTVAYDQVKYEHAMQTNFDDDRLHWSYIEVPYRFCSDEFRGNLACYVWDTGVDVGEMVQTAINSIDEYYVFDAFKRERMYSGSDSFVSYYLARVQSRYMAILADSARYFAIYDNIFNDRSWYPAHVANPHGMKALADASRTSFNKLAQILATPAPGSFVKDPVDQVYRNTTYEMNQPGSDLSVPLGVGKFPYTQYLGAEHYGFENHVAWVGSFWLKLAALMTLTDSTFYSGSDWVGEQLEIGRSTAVGFNTLYQREMTNLIGGVVAGELSQYGGVVYTDQATGQYMFRARDLFHPELDAGSDVIEPGLNNLTMKLWGSVLGLANLPAGFDPSFTDAMTVFLVGSGNEFELVGGGGGVQVAKFDDPFGAKTYAAYTPNYDAGRIAPAYELVQSAQALREQWDVATGSAKLQLASELKGKIEILDVLRQLHSIYGNLVY